MLKTLSDFGIDTSQLIAVAKSQGKVVFSGGAKGPGLYFVSRRTGPQKLEAPKEPSSGVRCSMDLATTQLLGCKSKASCDAQAALFFVPVGEPRAGWRAGKAVAKGGGFLDRLGVRLAGAAGRYGNLGKLADRAAIRSRAGGASQVNQLQTGYGGLTLGEISDLAVKGDREAVKAIKMAKQAGSKGKGGR